MNPVVHERPTDATGKFYIYRCPSGKEIITRPVQEEPDLPMPVLPKPRQSSTAQFLKGSKSSLLLFSLCHLFLLILPLLTDKSMHMPLSYNTLLDGIRINRARWTNRMRSSVPIYQMLVDARKRAAESSERLGAVVATIADHKKYLEEFKRAYFSDLARNLS